MSDYQMKGMWRLLRLVLLLCCVVSSEAKTRGEQEEKPRRELTRNVFDAAALKKNLAAQRTEYKDPFLNEPRINNIPSRNNNALKHEFRMTMGGDGYTTIPLATTAEVETEPELYPVLIVSGKGKGYSYSSSKSGKGMSKGTSKSKSKKSKSRSSASGKGVSAKQPMMGAPFTPFPTFAPTKEGEGTGPPSTTPMTDRPTCPPNSGVFPPDVSGFFGAPTGSGTDLENELNAALNEIQVPGAFNEQCVER